MNGGTDITNRLHLKDDMKCPLSLRLIGAGLLCILSRPLSPIQAQPAAVDKWTQSDPAGPDRFGNVLDIDSTVAVIGAPRDNDPQFGVGEYGAAYVYRLERGTWTEEAKLTAPQREFYAWFGRSVAVAGDVVLASIRNDQATADGAVYAYRWGSGAWTQETKLTASDRQGGHNFGSALALDGDVALVGAPYRSESGSGEGAVYVFRYAGRQWSEEAILTPGDPSTSKYFGSSVALSGDRALIGAWGESPQEVGQNAGAAYVFEYDGQSWSERQKLDASDATAQAQFGLSVALDGDRALLGAPLDNQLGGGAGAAYVFHFDGAAWSEEAKLLASDHSGFNLFGSAVALEGGYAVVGAPNWFAPGEDAWGKAYLYTVDAVNGLWVEANGFVPEDGRAGDGFGSAVGISQGQLLVGAPEHDEPVGNAGAVYRFELHAAPTSHEVPAVYAMHLSPAYPNPFWSDTRLTLTLGRPGPVHVALYDLLGRRLRDLHDGHLVAGSPLFIDLAGADLPGGTYMVRAVTEDGNVTSKVTRVR